MKKNYYKGPMKFVRKTIHYPHGVVAGDKYVHADKVIISEKMAQRIINSIRIINEKLREK